MKKNTKYILAILPLALLAACKAYDSAPVKNEIDSILEELEALEQKAASLSGELNAISTLVKSEYITRISDDGKGNYTLKCIRDGVASTVELATSADVIYEALIGIGTYEDGKLYWRQSNDWGASWTWVKDKGGNMMPLEGAAPEISINADGCWAINGVSSGVLAVDKTMSLISGIEISEDKSSVVFTLTGGTTFSVLYKEALSLTLESPVYNAIENWGTSIAIPYKLGGNMASEATVDYFSAYNTSVSIDKAAKLIKVALLDGKEEGNTIIMATAGDEVVYRPLFFTHGKIITDLESYIKDNELVTPMGEPIIKLQGEMTPFTINISHNIDVEVSVSSDASSWLKYNPTKAAAVVTAFNFVADYYENTLDAERQGSIILSNSLYGISTKFAVIQKPIVLGGGGGGGGDTKGIATKADLLEFAKAVNAGGSTSRWENADGEICLLQDINLSDETSWTPIGYAQAEGTGTPTPVMSFKGVFNGQGHSISGINVSFDVTSSGRSIGLFGSLEGAIIKNLTVGAEGDCITATGNPTSTIAMAAVAGYAANTTMTNVINNVDVIYDAECPNGLPIGIGGITGYGKSLSYGSKNKADAVVNNGDIMVKYKIANTQNGAKGVQIGGMVGLLNMGTTVMRNCRNRGIVAAPTGRGGGLIGTIEGSTSASHPCTLSGCENSGLVCDDYFGHGYSPDNKRMGGLVGGSQAKDVMIESCTNSGNVFSVNGCRCGGMIGHFNSGTITGCTNEGAILSHITPKESDGSGGDGPGWIAGYCNTTIENCIPGGYVGEYSEFKDNPSGAPAADMTNAIGYKNSQYFDPAKNQ